LFYSIIRKFLLFIGLFRWNTVTLFHWEYPPDLDLQILQTISGGQLVSHVNPHNGLKERFVFQDRHIVRVKNVILDVETGVVFNAEGKIINETSNYSRDYLIATAFPRPFPSLLASENNSAKLFLPNNGFYHWLCEDLPSFIRNSAYYPNDSEVLVSKNIRKYAQDFLSMGNFQTKKSVRYQKFDELLFACYEQGSGWIDPRDVSLLKETFGVKQLPDSFRKLYVSRRNSRRSPSFELQLEKHLSDCGWDIILAEELTLLEQIEKFSQARMICGVGGANLANVIWANPKVTLIELSDIWFSPCFSRMSQYLGFKYILLEFRDSLNFDTKNLADRIENIS
jgi:hypothetical protein